ncbi:hypothetical protein HCN51_50150 [Nonomuraea sp. FMUSA5-5]|uniref:Uncharacterized protein n=1 Tax=Nonomuraea composti TaxID=2720023 RepID=A0ABX1BNX3_9ACTN|nr:hypothetical protein [Nonomuraea sp. FMUSA5-5]NJP97501.1 hypothetical protein [Nonomuraea sp. FMUSA5-5]
MTWIFLSAGLGVAGLIVLGVAGARVAVAARTLKREIAAAHAQLEPRRARLAGQGDETTPRAAYDRG